MSFKFTEQTHTERTNVWYDELYLGEIYTVLQERDDIDWSVYRADKTLKMSVEERYITKHIPTVKIGGEISRNLGSRPTQEEAAQAMLDYHRSSFNDS
tara:strand:- start:491 stop:784 length:294 start_codon:yes stop_codon:yes gene_type:complete